MLKDGTVYLRLGFVQKFTDLDAMYMKIRTELQSSTDLPECRQRQLKKIQVSVIRWNQVSDPDRCEDGGYINLSGRLEDWAQVATMDGYIGYVQKDMIASAETKDLRDHLRKRNIPILLWMEK